jgi:hypothetical protein
MPASRALSLWLPVLVWAAVIFTFSSIPSLGTGLGDWDTILRKGAHMTEYAILGLLLLRAIGRDCPRGRDRLRDHGRDPPALRQRPPRIADRRPHRHDRPGARDLRREGSPSATSGV